MNKEDYIQQQIVLLTKLQIPFAGDANNFFPQKGMLIFSFDIQYTLNTGYVAIGVQEWEGEHKGIFLKACDLAEEYEPGLFAFREGPLLHEALIAAEKEYGRADLLVIDGHGTAHFRKMGVASWLGIHANIPSIGVAKKTLLPYNGSLGIEQNSILSVYLEEELVGYTFRSQTNVNPIFVSSGHLVSQSNSLEIVKRLVGKYRIIESIRRADQAARKFAKESEN